MPRDIKQEEQWRPIEGYEQLYAISSHGRVKSLRYNRILFLSLGSRRSEYPAIRLHKDGQKPRKRVHRLVAQAFIPNPEKKPEVNHKNGIKTDNRVENLEWCTGSENVRDSLAKGRRRTRLTPRDLERIKELYGTGKESQSQLARRFGVNRSLIGAIVRGEKYKSPLPSKASAQDHE